MIELQLERRALPKKKIEPEFKCEFCGKALSTELYLINHSCTGKLRWGDKDLKQVKIGFLAYQKFYSMSFKQNNKTHADFIKSNYYNAFTKFGRHVLQLNLLNPEDFVDFVLRSGQPIDKWCSSVLVEEYIKQRQAKESWETGLERTILTMQEWAQKENHHWTEYFDRITTSEIVHHIRLGKISPWILYNSRKASSALMRMNHEQINLIETVIDSKLWKRKMLKEADEILALRKFIEDCKI